MIGFTYRKSTAVILAVLSLISLLVCGSGSAVVHAESSETAVYSNVVSDLRKDKNFNIEDYTADNANRGLEIIQIAETTDQELIVYFYQPAAKSNRMELTTIRLATTYENGPWEDYDLTLLSSSGTLSKYRVEGLEVSAKSTRYYNVTAVHRLPDKYLDEGLSTSASVNEVAMSIAQLWTVVTVGGDVLYSMEKIDVVTIINPQYGTVRYSDGVSWGAAHACDSHFIAFSTDWNIEQLIEADVSFKYRTYSEGIYNTDYDKPLSKTVTVTYKERGSVSGDYWLSSNRTWDRIQTGAEFVQNCDILDEEIAKEIKNQQWVLSYYETDYESDLGGIRSYIFFWDALGALFGSHYKNGTEVSDATILRLKFLSEGEVYNLGAVSNKSGTSEVVGSDDITLGEKTKTWFEDWFFGWADSVPWWGWIIVAVVVICAGFALLCKFAPDLVEAALKVAGKVITALGNAFVWVLKKIWWLVCLPFRGIAALFRRRKEKKQGKGENA